MDPTPSDRLSSHLDALRPSSSSPRRGWSQHPPSSAFSPTPETASSSSQQANPCRYETGLDETTRAYRTTALRHLNGNSKPLSWKTRQAAHSAGSGRSSSLASQPVLVRSYSGGPDDKSGTSKMPTRRSFLFTGASNPQRRVPELPSDEEFSIDGILRAIDPDIRSTLNSIGEICGRSKLSLANEYGSHIAPLGEIRAPPGGLLPVEEANSDHEGYSGDNVVIYDDDNNAGDGREHTLFSNYTFFDALLPPISAPSRNFDADSPSSHTALNQSGIESLPTTREFASKPKAAGRALLGTSTEVDVDDRVQTILTPALVSEILLDAQAHDCLLTTHPLPDQPPQRPGITKRWSEPAKSSDVQSLFRWLKLAAWNDCSASERQTAEMRLRAMLGRQTEQTA
ncbi:uncharacterized protein BJX67DRAFT_260862 [Aspergillus lucknowensis]|uniref:Uncharacterized protein n=1 Tax=Aspergillus lucknowensis TaxID=176173 RepID=A0ABR4LGB8_9EURO